MAPAAVPDKADHGVPKAAASKPAVVKRPAAAVAKPLAAIVAPGRHTHSHMLTCMEKQ